MILYVEGDLFKAPYGEILVHSCNTMGRWGAGVAVEFKNRYPEAFQLYQKTCAGYGKLLLGKAQITSCNGHMIGNLFVSKGYGWAKDSEEEILKHTAWALKDLAHQIHPFKTKVHMPMINSGHFKVPWHKTESLILEHLCPAAGVIVYKLETK
jgi:ADP-ribose 1''-phosphate phosphatase